MLFRRIVREVIMEFQAPPARVNKIMAEAIDCLQEATKAFITAYFSSKCITLMHYSIVEISDTKTW